MHLIKKILNIIMNRRKFFSFLECTGIYNLLPDKYYLMFKYWFVTGRKLNLKEPKGFCEKLQWLKLYDRKPLYTSLVDKYKVRLYVEDKIGKDYLIPLLGVWNSANDIDFNSLPNQFVLKCNHNSGEGMCICLDKTQLDFNTIRHNLTKALKHGYYNVNRQWPYKNVERKIICEKYMTDPYIKNSNNISGEGLLDYKFYCFNGEPKFLYIGCACITNNIKKDKLSFYNLDWSNAEFYRKDHQKLDLYIEKPKNLNEMIEISRKLSKNIPFIRVDLYNINNHIYFSELTFSPGGGLGMFYPQEYELLFGNYIKIDI